VKGFCCSLLPRRIEKRCSSVHDKRACARLTLFFRGAKARIFTGMLAFDVELKDGALAALLVQPSYIMTGPVMRVGLGLGVIRKYTAIVATLDANPVVRDHQAPAVQTRAATAKVIFLSHRILL
jgi:hypothetical protein